MSIRLNNKNNTAAATTGSTRGGGLAAIHQNNRDGDNTCNNNSNDINSEFQPVFSMTDAEFALKLDESTYVGGSRRHH